MRRLFVTAFIVMTMALSAPAVHAGNQEEANRIAKIINTAFPQYVVEVAYQEGKVRLRGEVGSEMDRQAIIQMVKQTPKVRSVSDSFAISGNPSANPYFGAMNSPMNTDSAVQMVSATQMMPAIPTAAPAALNTVPTDNFFPNNGGQTGNPIMVAETTNNPYPTGNEFAMNSAENVVGAPAATAVGNGSLFTENSASVNYSPAPQGYPVQAGQNGQNGQPNLPNYAWPTTADYPNYAQVGYPKQYSASSFPYIGPFYPYPQVPLGWRKVTMEWHDGYWWLDFNDGSANGPFSPLFRQPTKYR